MGSRALIADSKETWVCSYLSLALLIGVGSYAVSGWRWVDSVGEPVMLPVIVWQGWETLTEAANTTLKSTDRSGHWREGWSFPQCRVPP